MAERPHILILGGTSEAVAAAGALAARYAVTYALAGRTERPALPAGCDVRTGGFGGADGLAEWMEGASVAALVDATHPFARTIAANAATAAGATRTPRLKLVRPPWTETPGDCWRHARDVTEAARLVGDAAQTVFLAIGYQQLAAFSGLAKPRFVVRTIDPGTGIPLAGAVHVTGRGPFTIRQETELLQEHGVDVMVTRNSGGRATQAKIAAARETDTPVVMIDRPPLPDGEVRTDAHGAVSWVLDRLRQRSAPVRTEPP